MKIVIIGTLVLFAFLGVISSALLLTKHLDTQRSEFSSFKEMENAGLINRGWLPEYFPRSATNIQEGHNLDTNEVWASFNFEQNIVKSNESNCRKIAENSIGKKFLCPAYETATVTFILRNNGTSAYFSHEYGI